MIYVDAATWWSTNWYLVLIGVLGGLLFLWILAFVVAISFTTMFKRNIDKTSVALNLLLTQRRDAMLDLIKIIESHDVNVSLEDINLINRLERVENFQALSKDERDDRVLTFVHGSHNLINLAQRHEEIYNDDDYKTLIAIFDDIEESYRRKVGAYNYHVTGYNYWIKIPTVKWLLKLMKHSQKDLIV